MKPLLVHWQVKLVALFLAVALWFYTSGQARVEKTVVVKVGDGAVLGLPPEYRISSIAPGEFEIVVDGPMNVLARLEKRGLAPRLEISTTALQANKQVFPITNQVLGLDGDARIQRTTPDTVARDGITVTFGKIAIVDIWVEPPQLIDVPPGIEPSLALEEGQARVEGPLGALDEIDRHGGKVRFQPVSLGRFDTQIEKPETRRIQLTPALPTSLRLAKPAYAQLTLKPLDAPRQLVSLPLHVLVPPDFHRRFQVELGQQQVVMAVRGPRNLMAGLGPDSLTAYVNLRRSFDLNKTEEVAVSLLAPPWVTWEPSAVRVTVSLAAKPSEAAPVAPLQPANTPLQRP
ncbi:MAG: hypothetical protein H0W72_03025 [Planctomycetes bacterium]|nr:hypothetical protein [Planctomycetota bacterium]